MAEKLKLNLQLPIVEIIEVKKNKSFIAKKLKFLKKKKIHNNAPIASVQINNISKNKITNKKNKNDKFYIIIASFYSAKSAQNF